MSLLFLQSDGSESALLPAELSLVISDSIQAPATFLVVHQMALAIKAKRPCIVLGAAQSFEYYTALLRKQSIQLSSERDKGSVKFIDGRECLSASTASAPVDALNSLPNLVSRESIVIVDDLSSFLYAGAPVLDVLRAFRRIIAAVRKSQASLLCVLHDDPFSAGKVEMERPPDDLFLLRNVIQLCDIWIQTRSLRAQMAGELIVHRAPSWLSPTPLTTYTINNPLQYRLEEGTLADYFAKGTGKGYL